MKGRLPCGGQIDLGREVSCACVEVTFKPGPIVEVTFKQVPLPYLLKRTIILSFQTWVSMVLGAV